MILDHLKLDMETDSGTGRMPPLTILVRDLLLRAAAGPGALVHNQEIASFLRNVSTWRLIEQISSTYSACMLAQTFQFRVRALPEPRARSFGLLTWGS